VTLDPISLVSALVVPPDTAAEPTSADPLQSNDPEELRSTAERANGGIWYRDDTKETSVPVTFEPVPWRK
jgi:hypothetical protein